MQKTHEEQRQGTYTVVDETECDLCHRRVKGDGWKKDRYDSLEIHVSMKTGGNYPEGGHGDLVEYDICPDCFQDKLMAWLTTQGAIPRKTEWDY